MAQALRRYLGVSIVGNLVWEICSCRSTLHTLDDRHTQTAGLRGCPPARSVHMGPQPIQPEKRRPGWERSSLLQTASRSGQV